MPSRTVTSIVGRLFRRRASASFSAMRVSQVESRASARKFDRWREGVDVRLLNHVLRLGIVVQDGASNSVQCADCDA